MNLEVSNDALTEPILTRNFTFLRIIFRLRARVAGIQAHGARRLVLRKMLSELQVNSLVKYSSSWDILYELARGC